MGKAGTKEQICKLAAVLVLLAAVLCFNRNTQASTTCVWCHGKGEVSCDNCGGSGRASGSVVGSCYKCHGSGYISCKYCGGTGKLGADTGSGRSSGGTGGSASNISLSRTSIKLVIGKKMTLKASGASGKVAWKSTKPSVASVSSKGVVKAKKKGTAKIVASCRGKKAVCVVKVSKKTYAKKIRLINPPKTLLAGRSAALSYKLTPDKSKVNQKYKITWKSSNPAAATVSSGTVKAKKAGTTTITAVLKSHGKTKKDSCKITVETGAQRLLKFMKGSKAKANPDGTRTFQSDESYLVYDSSAGTFTFKYDEGYSIITMTCPVSMTGKVDLYYRYNSRFGSWVYEVSGTDTVAGIRKEKQYAWNIIKATGGSSSLANTAMDVLLSCFNVILRDEIGAYMNEVGFSGY